MNRINYYCHGLYYEKELTGKFIITFDFGN